MNDSISFRGINEFEQNIIGSSLEKIILNSKNLMLNLYTNIARDKYPSIFLISKSLKQELQNFGKHNYLVSAGLYFGFIKKGRFFISLEAIEYLHKNKKISEKSNLIVNKDGEKSVLYGNDVQKKMVVGVPRNLTEGDFLVILNEIYELLAIGFSKVNHSAFQGLEQERIVAKTLIDKGSYLRRKQ
jgi:ribosome biogenesis protein Nip4